MHSPNNASLIVSLLAAILILSGVALLERENTLDRRETAEWVNRTHQVQVRLNRVVLLVDDIENGERGFIVSGDPKYIRKVNDEIDEISELLTGLKQLITDDVQQAGLAELGMLATQRIALARNYIALRQNFGFAAAQKAMINDSEEQIAMAQIDALLETMTSRQNILLEQRSADNKRKEDINVLVNAIGTGLSIVLILLVFYFLRRENQLRHGALKPRVPTTHFGLTHLQWGH